MSSTKTKTVFRCGSCGAESPRWLGRCAACGEWSTLAEQLPEFRGVDGPVSDPVPLSSIPLDHITPIPTGVGELDRALGGGLVPGSVTLLGGEPGIGKSTLVLQALSGVARGQGQAMLVSAEESAPQVRDRAERLGGAPSGLALLTETSLPAIVGAVAAHRPAVVAVDSIQSVTYPDASGGAGSVTQVRECAHHLVRVAKETGTAVVLVGHVTKDGELAGPRVLEHVVDTVVAFEGDRHHALRLLRVRKHRFGDTDELGVLEMRCDGLVGVPDPSGLFLADRLPGTAGSVVAPVLEGMRPLLVEVQALVAKAGTPVPRRSVQGLEARRLALLLAVLSRRAAVSVTNADVYASVAGGLRVAEPGVDLALALAIAGAKTGQAFDPETVALGEVGLGGEIRQVAHAPRRLAEAARLGFRRAVVARRTPDASGLQLVRVGRLAEAVAVTGLG
ncbi:MAG: DNA repair protein RadA [Actinobacteria bacterium]|nr:DNA repair protein RadA [Actinomycetota bacterium]